MTKTLMNQATNRIKIVRNFLLLKGLKSAEQQKMDKLTDRHFLVKKGSKGNNVLYFSLNEISLVIFISQEYQNFTANLLNKLSARIKGCNFYMVDVYKYPRIIDISKNTIMPITELPYIILYVNGYPFIKYREKLDNTFHPKLENFLTKVLKYINENEHKLKDMQSRPTPYNVTCNDVMCYATSEELRNGQIDEAAPSTSQYVCYSDLCEGVVSLINQ